jgi:hypothetical protein
MRRYKKCWDDVFKWSGLTHLEGTILRHNFQLERTAQPLRVFASSMGKSQSEIGEIETQAIRRIHEVILRRRTGNPVVLSKYAQYSLPADWARLAMRIRQAH